MRTLTRLALIAAVIALPATTQASATDNAQHPFVDILLNYDDDCMGDFNRDAEDINACLVKSVLAPVGNVYVEFLPDGLPSRISDFAYNIEYPGRLVNNCLQGKWSNAWEETQRFGINTTVGILGFWDRATKKGYAVHDEDFGQTLACWGIGAGTYLNLPVFGPSTMRDAPAKVVDALLNPVSYVSSFATLGLNTNDLFREAQFLNVYFRTHKNSYPITRAMWRCAREVQLRDGAFPPVTSAPDESLAVLALKPRSSRFYLKARERTVQLPGAPQPLAYTIFKQKSFDGRILVVLPGLTSQRMDADMLALAEMYFNAGWNVAVISSTFTGDFFCSTPARLPGFVPQDIRNLDAALALIQKDIAQNAFKSDIAPATTVMGVSLGAINAVKLAALDAEGKSALKPQRLIAVNPPRKPLLALRKLDEYFDIPLTWPTETRLEQTKIAVQRIAYATLCPRENPALTLNHDESMAIIGLGMRIGMLNLVTEIIEAGNAELLAGVIRTDTPNHIIQDAMQLSYEDYVSRVLMPYAKASKLIAGDATLQTLSDASNLDSALPAIRNYPKIRIFHSENDFLLDSGDSAWFKASFQDRCVFFPTGSHLGALVNPSVQAALVQAAR